MSDQPTYGNLLNSAVSAFDYAGLDTPQMDARLLLLNIANLSHAELISQMHDPVPELVQSTFADYVSRRLSSEPVHRILAMREFYGREFVLQPDALIPRPDTESLIDVALQSVEDRTKALRILDLGTGSGIIAITLACEFPNADVLAVDISSEAVKNCAENADRHGVSKQVSALRSDLFEQVDGKFDLIVSNPPYIPTSDLNGLSSEVRKHDPIRALDGGADGFDFYRRIFTSAHEFLADDGLLALEFGVDQSEQLEALAVKQGYINTGITKDLGGVPRVLVAKRL